MSKNQLNFWGSGGTGTGYGGAIEQLVISLERRSDTDVTTAAFNKVHPSNISPALAKIKAKPFRVADIGIVTGAPAMAESNMSKFRVLYTMFETDRLPSGINSWVGKSGDAVQTINQYSDLLVVPCQHNKELFEQSGVAVPIEVVPLGINPELFPYMERPERKTFTFFMYGTLTLRKNPGAVISAFATLFRHNPDVRLVLKTQSGTLGHIEYKDMGDITVIDALWSIEDLQKALFDADAFVFPSRGEGFGLPPLEAMSTGLPVILSDNTGLSEYANPRHNYPVPTKEKQPAQRYPKKWGDVGNWYEPDYEILKKQMQTVYENRDAARTKGELASREAQKNWTYDIAAEKLVAAIKKHYKGWQ